MNKVVPSLRFGKELKRLLNQNEKYVQRVNKCMRLLGIDINHPSLRLHKLAGRETYSVSVDMKIRILIQLDAGDIHLLRIGTHNEVY